MIQFENGTLQKAVPQKDEVQGPRYTCRYQDGNVWLAINYLRRWNSSFKILRLFTSSITFSSNLVPEIYYRRHRRIPFDSLPNQSNCIKILIFHLFKIHFNIILLSMRRSPQDVFQFVVLYKYLSCASCLLHIQPIPHSW